MALAASMARVEEGRLEESLPLRLASCKRVHVDNDDVHWRAIGLKGCCCLTQEVLPLVLRVAADAADVSRAQSGPLHVSTRYLDCLHP